MDKFWHRLRQPFYNFYYRVLRRPMRMYVRHDTCRAAKPEATIIFIHGIASSFTAWRESVSMLTQDEELSKVRFIGIDLIGFGKSPRPDWFKYDYASYRRALKHTIRKLKIKTPIIFAGHSMGCLISMDYALRANDKRVKHLILVSPPIFRRNESASIYDHFYAKTYDKLKDNTSNPVLGAVASVVSALSSFDHKTFDTVAFKKCMVNIILNEANWNDYMHAKISCEVVHGRFDPLIVGQNVYLVCEKNTHMHLTDSLGDHDIKGPKMKKILRVIKETCLHEILVEE